MTASTGRALPSGYVKFKTPPAEMTDYEIRDELADPQTPTERTKALTAQVDTRRALRSSGEIRTARGAA